MAARVIGNRRVRPRSGYFRYYVVLFPSSALWGYTDFEIDVCPRHIGFPLTSQNKSPIDVTAAGYIDWMRLRF